MSYPDDAMRARVQSIARTFPEGITLVSQGRPGIRYISIQNRDNKSVYFWHGDFPSGATGSGPALPIDPASWSPAQLADAKLMIKAYGENIAAGVTFQPIIAHSGRLYSYVEVGSAICHVKQGD
jgi:hypothetical protein